LSTFLFDCFKKKMAFLHDHLHIGTFLIKIIQKFVISMRCEIQRADLIIILIYLFLIVDLCLNWSAYSNCYAPIQLFLLETYLLIVVHRIVSLIKGDPNTSRPWKKCSSFLIYWVINPGFIVITIEGIIWQIQDDQYTENCIPINRVPWIVHMWIIILVIIDILVILISIFKIIKWWRIRTFRRRIDILMQELSTLDQNALGQILLQSVPGDLNNQIGLTEEDLSTIASTTFSESDASIFSISDSCAICCEDFHIDEEITKLPICNHRFHKKCVTEWLVRNPLCPMCRGNV